MWPLRRARPLTNLASVIQPIRRVGIAIGSVAIAWLAVSFFVGALPGVLAGLVVIVLGGLIYRDILGRDHRS